MENQPLYKKLPLLEHQQKTQDLILKNNYFGLFLDMGLGKTRIILDTLQKLNLKNHTLIVGTVKITKGTWQNEIKKWGYNLPYQELHVNKNMNRLSKEKRHELYEQIQYNKTPTIYFINYELIKDLVTWMVTHRIWVFPNVILDEAHKIKSHSSQAFKHLYAVRPYIRRLWVLTGTPVPKNIGDMWTQISILDQGKRLGKNISTFRDNYMMVTRRNQNGQPIAWGVQSQSKVDEIYKKISNICITMEAKNIIKLPDIIIENNITELNKKEKEIYKKLEKEKVLDINNQTINPPNKGILYAKLLQMASGTLYYTNEDETKEIIYIHDKKLDMLECILEEVPKPVLIAYWFNIDEKRIKEHLKNYRVKSTKEMKNVEEEFNIKNLDVLLIHPASDAEGLNLQHNGNVIIWYTLPWSYALYSQTNRRIYRTGQTKTTFVHHIIVKGSLDEYILRVLNAKKNLHNEVMDNLNYDIRTEVIDNYLKNTEKKDE